MVVRGGGRKGRCFGFTSLVVFACEASSDSIVDRDFAVALELDEAHGALLSVWGSTWSDVYAVGGQPQMGDQPGRGMLWHYDGNDWSQQELPADTPLLNWVFGIDSNLWAVGEAGVALRRGAAGWDTLETGTSAPLWGIWGASPADLWAVGGDPFGQSPTLLHFDGAQWQAAPLPELDRPSAALFKIWGTGSDNVIAVGDAGIILHFDGSRWRQESSGTGADLISLWGSSASDIVVAGGRSNAELVRWNGSRWQHQTLAGLAGLNGCWVDPSGEATVVGNLGALASIDPGTFDFTTEDSHALTYSLHAVYGFTDGTRFAVGGTLLSTPPWRGILVSRTQD